MKKLIEFQEDKHEEDVADERSGDDDCRINN